MIIFFEIPLVLVLIFLIISAAVAGEVSMIVSTWMPTIALICAILFAVFVLIMIIIGFSEEEALYSLIAVFNILRGALISYGIYYILNQISYSEVESGFFALIGSILSFAFEMIFAFLLITIMVCADAIVAYGEICSIDDSLIITHILSFASTIGMFIIFNMF